jgi:tellurite resistance protein
MQEATFLALFGTPYMRWVGRDHAYSRVKRSMAELRHLPHITTILMHIDQGGFADAVIRMLILLAQTRQSVRRDRLERSAQVLTKDEPFASLGGEKRAVIIHEQTIIAEFEPQRAIETLPSLVKSAKERERAIAVVEFILGSTADMEPPTHALLQRLRAALGLAPLPTVEFKEDPLEA